MDSSNVESLAPTNSQVTNARLDGLPLEMLHRIMNLLPPAEEYSARLACSLLATVGEEYLTSEARLVYEP